MVNLAPTGDNLWKHSSVYRKFCSSDTVYTTNPTWTALGSKPGLGGEKLVTVLWHGLIPDYEYQHSAVCLLTVLTEILQ